MKKNDKQLIKNFRNNYIMCIPDYDDKFTEAEYSRAEIGDYFFDGKNIAQEFYIPAPEENDVIYQLRLSYHFNCYLNEEKKLQIVFNDFNRPQVNMRVINANKNTELKEFIDVERNDLFFSEFNKKPFSNFALEDCAKELDGFFNSLNEQYFFDFKVKKDKVILNRTLLDSLKKHFHYDLKNLLTQLEKGDAPSRLQIKYQHQIDTNVSKSISYAIKNAEKNYEYDKLKADLNESLQDKPESVQPKKPKI